MTPSSNESGLEMLPSFQRRSEPQSSDDEEAAEGPIMTRPGALAGADSPKM